jgi:hypothetical protein
MTFSNSSRIVKKKKKKRIKNNKVNINQLNNMRYKQNLKYIDGVVYSYNTAVAKREGDKLIVEKWYSTTTSKHINYIARLYGFKVVKNY